MSSHNYSLDTWFRLGNDDSSKISAPQTEAEYNRLVAMLDELIDEVGEDEAHPLASLTEIIGVMIEHYENANVPGLVQVCSEDHKQYS